MPMTLESNTALRRPARLPWLPSSCSSSATSSRTPAVNKARKSGHLTFLPWHGDGIAEVGRLSLFGHPRAPWKPGSYLGMEAVVLNPDVVTNGNGLALDRVAILPVGDYAGHYLGPVALDLLRPDLNSAGPVEGDGLLRLDELVEDHQNFCPIFIPVEVVSYSSMADLAGPRPPRLGPLGDVHVGDARRRRCRRCATHRRRPPDPCRSSGARRWPPHQPRARGDSHPPGRPGAVAGPPSPDASHPGRRHEAKVIASVPAVPHPARDPVNPSRKRGRPTGPPVTEHRAAGRRSTV